jgi:hypothetical protein
VSWLQAAPLICSGACSAGGGATSAQPQLQQATRLMGAVLVGGRGREPAVNPQWLQQWACEMACGIKTCSVQLMEVGAGL